MGFHVKHIHKYVRWLKNHRASYRKDCEVSPEYAISTCSCACDTGASMTATEEILRIAFQELGLKRVYLNVLADNGRANVLTIRGQEKTLNWYEMG